MIPSLTKKAMDNIVTWAGLPKAAGPTAAGSTVTFAPTPVPAVTAQAVDAASDAVDVWGFRPPLTPDTLAAPCPLEFVAAGRDCWIDERSAWYDDEQHVIEYEVGIGGGEDDDESRSFFMDPDDETNDRPTYGEVLWEILCWGEPGVPSFDGVPLAARQAIAIDRVQAANRLLHVYIGRAVGAEAVLLALPPVPTDFVAAMTAAYRGQVPVALEGAPVILPL